MDDPPATSGDEPHSGDIATDDMAASISAEQYAPGETIRVYAALLHQGKYVTLTDGDELYVDIGGERAVMLRQPQSEEGVVRYMTGIRPRSGATTLNVSLMRPEGKVSALRSTIAVPAPFEIASQVPAEVRYGDTVTVKLSPAPQIGVTESLEARIGGSCLGKETVRKVALSGDSVKIPTEGLAVKEAMGPCELAVQVRHVAQAPVDSKFAKSFLPTTEGVQARGFTTKLIR